jgi:hypothetical protein
MAVAAYRMLENRLSLYTISVSLERIMTIREVMYSLEAVQKLPLEV